MKKRACSRDCPDLIVPICNLYLQKSIRSNGITNTPRKATARWTIWVNSWLAVGRLSTQDADHLTLVLTQLVELYRRHIAMEDTEVFPFAAHALAPSDRHAIGAEMAARRGIRSAA